MEIVCKIVKNENGTFLVFENEDAAAKAQEALPAQFPVACCDGYYNALKIAEA